MKNKLFTLLYVDDEESNLRAFKNTFRREFNIHIAKSGAEGIVLLKKHHIDIILSDQRMPDMTGVEFLKYSLDTYPDVNRILVTGYTDFSALYNAINKAKIFKYIQKPWSKNQLMEHIEAGIQIQELEKKNQNLTNDLSKSVEELKDEISRRKKAQDVLQEKNEELIKAKTKAEESDRLKGAFLANISHEIRTPMNGIKGFSNLLMSQDITEEEQNTFLNIIVQSSDQLMFIIDQILEISTIDAKQLVLNQSVNNISYIFENFHKEFEKRSKKKNLKLVWPKLDEHTHISFSTDWEKLTGIISNIIDNAIIYTHEGEITVSFKLSENNIEFEISDTGIGIAEEIIPYIYRRFRQSDDSFTKLSGGLGLGLCISKAYIDILNGTIELKTEVNKGSVFSVSVPISVSETPKQADINADLSSQKDFCVLIAEDEINNFEYLKFALKYEFPAIKIIHAKNGKEAILKFEENKDIDLILMDIKMPIMDGLQATKLIREQSATIPIIMQSAFINDKTIQQAKINGCNSYLNKPIEMEELKGIINEYAFHQGRPLS